MPFPIITTFERIFRLQALITAEYSPEVDEEAKIWLYQNDVTPDAGMSYDTFVKATFAGFTFRELVMLTPSMNDQGLIVSKSQLVNWASAAGVDPQTCYGVFITDNSETKVIAAQRFEAPQQMGGDYPQAISGVWRISEPDSSIGWIDVEV